MFYIALAFISGVFVGVLYAPAKSFVAKVLKAYADWKARS
jgi:hypothetical protein